MDVLKALMQNCKMANATSNSTSVFLTENDIPCRSCLERRKLAKLKRRSLSSLNLVVLDAIMNTVYSNERKAKGTNNSPRTRMEYPDAGPKTGLC